MSAVEKIDNNKIKLTFEVTPERFREGLTYAYNKVKNQINIPGFRKGKASRKVIERLYGAEFFYEEAINYVLPQAYEDTLTANDIEPVYKPSISLQEATEEKGVIFTAVVYIKPEVTIENYCGITYPVSDTEPTEADIQERLNVERDKNARIISVDRPAENGDVVVINYTGYVDGEPFEGGKADNQDLTLGSHLFVDTFEEQLIGHVPGDNVEVHVTFPETYNHKSLAGKAALFEVEILDVKIREYPEINDEFAQDISEYDTLEEYRQHVADIIREAKIKKAQEDKESYVLQRLVERAEMQVPEPMYTARVDEMVDDFRYRLQTQGMTMEMYLQYAGIDEFFLKTQYAIVARESVNHQLVLEAVAKKEAMTVSEDEYNEHVALMATSSGKSTEQFEKDITPERKKLIVLDLLTKKAMDFVLAQAVPEETVENTEIAENTENTEIVETVENPETVEAVETTETTETTGTTVPTDPTEEVNA